MPNIDLDAIQTPTTYRKIAIASWNHPRDPTTYCWIDLPTTHIEAMLDNLPLQAGQAKPSLTHVIVKVLAHCLQQYPALNHLLRARALYKRKTVDVFVSTLLKTKHGNDLSGFKVSNVPQLGLLEVAQQSQQLAERLRSGQDEGLKGINQLIGAMPRWLMVPFMRIQDLMQYSLNISFKPFGVPDDQFGSAIVTNLAPLGLENALIPLSPYSRCPLVVGIGKTRLIPMVNSQGQVVAERCTTLTFSFDHRYGDGAHGAQLMRLFQKVFANPELFAGVLEGKGA